MILLAALLGMATFSAPLPQLDGYEGGLGQFGSLMGGGMGHMGGFGGIGNMGSMDGGMGHMGGLGMGIQNMFGMTPRVNLNQMEAGNSIKDKNGVGMTWAGWNEAI
jgi:hypothetical protein